MYKNSEYDIWDNDNPAAKVLRENMPWHLTSEEKARQPGFEPVSDTLPDLSAAKPQLDATKITNGIANLVTGAMEGHYHQKQEEKRIRDFFNKPATASGTDTLTRPLSPAGADTNPSSGPYGLEKAPQAKPDALPVQQPSASTYPYPAMDKLLQPTGDKIIREAVEPAVKDFVQAVKNKESADAPEADLVRNASVLAQPVSAALHHAYTGDNYIKAADAIHEGNTEGMARFYWNPADSSIFAAIHAGDTLNTENTMANPDPDIDKGIRNTIDETKLGLATARQFGNRLFDSEGKYLPTKAYGQWIRDEEKRLEANQVPELVDFTAINWKENPDKVIELGGKYFHQSFLGTHLFGFAVDAMKGKAGPIANQVVSTVTGIARFYNATDDIMAAVIRGGALSSTENWDFVVGQLAAKLPRLSRTALQFMNSVLSRELKARMFNSMLKEYKAREALEARPSGAPRPSNTQKGQP